MALCIIDLIDSNASASHREVRNLVMIQGVKLFFQSVAHCHIEPLNPERAVLMPCQHILNSVIARSTT